MNDRSRVAGAVAAVLAAGSARRFGGGKQLARLYGRPLAAWPVLAALASGLEEVAVVLGHRGEEVAQALPAHPRLTYLTNPAHELGLGSSLAVAARWALAQGAQVLVVLLGDQPLVQPGTVRRVAQAALDSPAGAAAALASGGRAHPVAFTHRYLVELAGLQADQGGRDLLRSLGAAVALVPAPPESALDVDQQQDLTRLEAVAEGLLAWAAPGPLCLALGLLAPQVVALAGSGGKTSLLYALARELALAGQRVAITTTTRIYPPQADQASGLWLVGQAKPVPEELAMRLEPGRPLCLATGRDATGKLTGLTLDQVSCLAALPELWVLVEADGAAGRPLKGWAAHEPVLPREAGLVAVVAGAQGLGRPLDEQWVHRPELFATAGGLQPGQAISAAALARVLSGPQGPLRHLPSGARAVLVLNQAETLASDDLAALGQELARTGAFARLLKASLRQGRLQRWEED